MHIFCEFDDDDENVADEYERSRDNNFMVNGLTSFRIGGFSTDVLVSSTWSNNRSDRRLFRSEFQSVEKKSSFLAQ